MTLKELSQVYYLTKEIEHDKTEIKRLREAACGSSPQYTGMPSSHASKSKIESSVESIADVEAMIRNRMELRKLEEKRIMQFIESIEDYKTRQIFRLRFCELNTWNEVADAMGGNCTSDSVKKKVYRFLKKV